MAYNNYFQTPYQIYNPYQQFQPSFQQQMQNQPNYQQSQQPIQQQIQNGGFVSVHNENEARNYPIAPGNSVTFKDENAPFIYVKTRGFSQLEEPVFEQFQLVKVDNSQKATEPEQTTNTEYALKSELSALKEEIDLLKKKVSEFKLAVHEGEAKA